MRLIVFICLFFGLQLSHVAAQDFVVQKSDSTVQIEDETYLIHTVEAKQTLFSIAKAYEVKLSRIAFDNPGVLDGLKLGQSLRILKSALGETLPLEVSGEMLELDGEFVLYTVPKQQTLYAISKEFNTTIQAILDANPSLSEGLKVGSVIRVPVPKIFEAKDSTKVEMIGLPDIVRTRVSKSDTVLGQMISSNVSNVVLALPLYLDLNDTVSVNQLEGEEESIYSKSEIGLQFYEGFLLALDTLSKLGYNVNVKVVDTENRPWKVRKLVAQGEFKKADLILGPLYSKVFSEVDKYAFDNCIPIVSPTIKGSSIIANNDYVFKLIPSDEAMTVGLGEYVAQSDSTNNLILHYGSSEEKAMLSRFRQGLQASEMQSASFPAYNLSTTSLDSIKLLVSLTQRNNVVILSNNQVKLAGLTRKISGWAEDAYIVAYVPSTWPNFRNLEIDHFDELRVHLPTSFFIDYEDVEVQHFVKTFREKYAAEPSTFAFRGYDIAMHFIKNISMIKSEGIDFMSAVKSTGLQSSLNWKKLNNGGF